MKPELKMIEVFHFNAAPAAKKIDASTVIIWYVYQLLA